MTDVVNVDDPANGEVAQIAFEFDSREPAVSSPQASWNVVSSIASRPVGHEVEVLRGDELAGACGRLFARDATESAIISGDTHKALDNMPAGVFRTCITSPPYWSLRDYGLPGQIGLEPSVYDYLDALVRILDQVRRVLADDGSLWVNLGDSYTSGNRTWRAPDKKNPARAMDVRPSTPDGLKPKDLIGVPWRLGLKLQEAGWFLRTDIIWNKPNCQPESVRDRPTRSHEYIFLMSKSERYFYDIEAIEGPRGRRLRTVWDIHTQSADKPAHFAAFPPALVEPCVAHSTKPGGPCTGSFPRIRNHGPRSTFDREAFRWLRDSPRVRRDGTGPNYPRNPGLRQFTPPPVSRQLAFHERLVAARTQHLMPALREAVTRVDPIGLSRELA